MHRNSLPSFAGLAALSCLTLACATDAPPTCEDATAVIEDCYGAEAASAFTCTPESVEGIADKSCQELGDAEAKSDLSLCDIFGIFCPADPIFPTPEGFATQFPLVLAHGFNGSPENEWGVNPIIIDELRRDGHEVFIARVSPFQSVEIRAGELAAQVDAALEQFGAQKVNIIAHSMGGLDSRFLISSLAFHDKVASLVTISSPHRGTLVADVALGLIPEFADNIVNALTKAFARTFTTEELANNSSIRAAFQSLDESTAADFNAANPDHDAVYYQSWAGVTNVGRIPGPHDKDVCLADGGQMHQSENGKLDFMDLRLVPAAGIVSHGTQLRPNDGMATVESARWGEFMGCIPADHYDEVGQVNDDAFDKATGFSATDFYRTIAFDLSSRGF